MFADTENGPSERDFDGYPEPEEQRDRCPIHGEVTVIGAHAGGGSDPWEVTELSCGHHVTHFGPSPAETVIVNDPKGAQARREHVTRAWDAHQGGDDA